MKRKDVLLFAGVMGFVLVVSLLCNVLLTREVGRLRELNARAAADTAFWKDLAQYNGTTAHAAVHVAQQAQRDAGY